MGKQSCYTWTRQKWKKNDESKEEHAPRMSLWRTKEAPTKAVITCMCQFRSPLTPRGLRGGLQPPKIQTLPYFFFFPPLPCPPLRPCPPVAGPLAPALSTTPCVAPPPPFLLPRACWNVDLSLFLSHRSGSGGGVTPGTTPFGTRLERTPRTAACSLPASPVVLAEAVTPRPVTFDKLGSTGGGACSSDPVTSELRPSSARR